MKTAFIAACVLALATPAFAQFSQGRRLVDIDTGERVRDDVSCSLRIDGEEMVNLRRGETCKVSRLPGSRNTKIVTARETYILRRDEFVDSEARLFVEGSRSAVATLYTTGKTNDPCWRNGDTDSRFCAR